MKIQVNNTHLHMKERRSFQLAVKHFKHPVKGPFDLDLTCLYMGNIWQLKENYNDRFLTVLINLLLSDTYLLSGL